MEKTYTIYGADSREIITFSATFEQARLIWAASYDTLETTLLEDPRKGDSLIFEHQRDRFVSVMMPLEDGSTKHLFDFYQNDNGEFIQADIDSGEDIEKLDLHDLMNFPGFVELIECQECGGEGLKEEHMECSQPASNCCGGCTRTVSCDCESVIFVI